MPTAQEFFEALPSRVTPERIEGMNNTYVFDIEGAGVWTVAVADGAITVTEGASDADCTVLLPDVPGAFCVLGVGTFCGCDGAGFCLTPCPN